jgi:TetR/AcrR family transcriptional regulator
LGQIYHEAAIRLVIADRFSLVERLSEGLTVVKKLVVERKIPEKIGNIRKRNEKMILEAAEEEFLAHGFRGASIRCIAERSGVPKANVLYYFESKLGVYGALLEGILAQWLQSFDQFDSDASPLEVMTSYIREKVAFSRLHPKSSRLFASEVIHGAPYLTEYLKIDLAEWVSQRSSQIRRWIDQGKMDDLNPMYVLFLIWGATQHYADYEAQIIHMTGKELTEEDYDDVTKTLLHIIIKGCGISE